MLLWVSTTKAHHLKASASRAQSAFLFVFLVLNFPHNSQKLFLSFSSTLCLGPHFMRSPSFFLCREEGPIFCTFFLISSLFIFGSVSFSLSLSLSLSSRGCVVVVGRTRRKHTHTSSSSSSSSSSRWALRRALRRRSNPTTRKNRLPKVLPRHHHHRL